MFKSFFRWGKQVHGKWSDICLLWGKCTETPRNASDGHKVFAFAPSSYFVFFVFSMTPSSHRQAGRSPPHPPRLFSVVLKGAHLHFKRARATASVSAAVTVFGRQAGNICWCDTDKVYLAADATSLPVSPWSRERKGVTERHKQPVWASDE